MKVKIELAGGAVYSAKVKAGKTAAETIAALVAKYAADRSVVATTGGGAA